MPTLSYLNLGQAPLPLPAVYALADGQPSVLAIDFATGRALIRDAVTPANNFNGNAADILTVTRASEGSYFDASGTLQYAAADTLRLDHDPVTGASLGVLVEEQRTNLFTYSEQFDNAVWGKERLSVSANAATAPDGTTTADKVVEDTTAANNHRMSVNISVASGAAHTVSFFFEAAERSLVVVRAETSNAAKGFDLAAGETYVSPVSGDPTDAKIVDVGGGIFRCDFTWTTSSTSELFRIYMTADQGAISYDGDGSSGLYIWGAQLEAGAFATSYIPTEGSQVTRAADQISIATSAYPHSATVGTLKAVARPLAASDLGGIVSVNDGSGDEEILLYKDASGNLLMQVEDGGSSQLAPLDSGQNASDDTEFILAGAWEADDFGLSADGAAAETDASGTLPAVTVLEVGVDQANNYLNGHIKRLAYYKARRSNADLQTLTAA